MTRHVSARQFNVPRGVGVAREPVRPVRRRKAKRTSHVFRDVSVILAFCGAFAAFAFTVGDRSGDAWSDTLRSFSATNQGAPSGPVVRFGK
jgi:hypothetical protein